MRVLTTLVGDVQRQADMRAKYGTFLDALSKKVDSLEIHDASLHGAERYWNALRSISFSRQRWKERFFRNVPAFQSRSKGFLRHVRRIQPSPDVVLQLGVLFDSTWEESTIPVVIYTDNTSAITARHPGAGRFAFNPWEQADWMAHEKECYRRAAHICRSCPSRDHKLAELKVADIQTGEVRDVMHELVGTFFESDNGRANWRYLPASSEVIWFSQRSDWGHLYLYDLATGEQKRQITNGAWNVTQLLHVDERSRTLYFSAVGREGSDPYFRYVYRVQMDGDRLELLSPAEADHDVSLNSSATLFVDTWSTPDTPSVSVVRDPSGAEVMGC